MKKLGLLAMAGVVVLSGCGGDDDEVEDLLRPPASLYFHNQLTDFTSPDASSIRVDVVTSKSSDPLFEDVGYSTDEQGGMNLKLDAGSETVEFSVRNSTMDLLDDSVTLKAGDNYTLVFMGDLAGGDMQLVPFRQRIPEIHPETVGVRFIHAMSQEANIGFSVLGEEDLRYAQASEYFNTLVKDNGRLEVFVEKASDGSPLETVSCAVQVGKVYDAIITHKGFADPDMAMFCQQVEGS